MDDHTLRWTATTWFSCINFMYFTLLLFVIVVVVTMVVSYCTEPPAPEQVAGKLVWDNFRVGNVQVSLQTQGVDETPVQESRPAGSRALVEMAGHGDVVD